MSLTESRTSLCAKYASLKRRIAVLKQNLLADEKQLSRIGEQIHSYVSIDGAFAHDNMVFCLDPSDRKLFVAPFREAADLDHPDGPAAFDLKDPLGVIEATRERLFRDSRPAVDPVDAHEAARDRLTHAKPVVEPDPDDALDDVLDESEHVVEVGHRIPAPRLVGRD